MIDYKGGRVLPITEHRTVDFAVLGDEYTACVCLGEQDSPVGPWKRTTAINRRVKTGAGAGADDAVEAVEAGTLPFQHVAAGDSIHFLGEHVATQAGGGRTSVVSKSDGDNIVVYDNVDLDIVPADELFKVDPEGYEFLFRTLSCEEVEEAP